MLTFFHFEKLTFESDVLGKNIICDSLIEHWRNYGCLILSKESLGNIKMYIDCYPPKSKEKWRIGLSHYKIIEVNTPEITLEQETETDELINKLKEINVNSLLHNQSNEELPAIDISKMSSINLEAINVGEIHSSINFNKSKQNSTSSITANDNIHGVWINKFNSLALVSKKITIIDRYLYQNIIRDHAAGKETALLKFIKLLPSGTRKYSISIYSDGEIKTSRTHENILSYIESSINSNQTLRSKISIIDFNSCLESYFINHAHDRLITFDDYACEIGIGMEIFSTAALRPTSFSIKPKSQTIFSTAYPKLSSDRTWHEEISF